MKGELGDTDKDLGLLGGQGSVGLNDELALFCTYVLFASPDLMTKNFSYDDR